MFPFRFELFAMIDGYLKVLSTKDVALPEATTTWCARPTSRCAPRSPRIRLPLAACHCDPLCENFLDTGERMWIVDWEYSGMNDPMWDLGDLVGRGAFDDGAGRGNDPRLFRRRARRRPSAAASSSTRRCATCCGRCGA